MPSPFPGMNPYLERQFEWDSFHNHFLIECLKRLVPQVSPSYVVRSNTRLYIHEPSAEERRFFAQADLAIAGRPSTATAMATTTKTAPQYRTIPACVETERVNYLEIRSKDDVVITVVELLSRSNKLPKSDRELFLMKRDELIRSDVHYVELNLLRAGQPLPFTPPFGGPYYAAVSRSDDRDRVGTWEWGIRDPLPIIPIPLRKPDGDVNLDLKSILNTVYDEGGFASSIYAHSPDPPLSPEDEAWAKSLIG